MARRSGHSNRRGSGDDAGLVLLLAALEGLLFWWVGKGIFGAAKKGYRRLRAAAETESLPAPSTPYKTALDNRYAWRLNCEDGSAYGLRPEDYETRAAYNAALASAKSASGLGHIRSKVGAGHGSTDAGQDSFTPASLVCRVSLLSNGKTETFRLDDPAIKVGDVISVTVDGKEDQGVVVAIEDGPRVEVHPARRKTAEAPHFDDFSAFFEGNPDLQERPAEEAAHESEAKAMMSTETAPAEEKPVSSHELDPAHVKKQPQRQGMSRKAKKILTYVCVAALALFVAGCVIAYKVSVDRALAAALEAYRAEAEALCDEYGISNVSTEVYEWGHMDDYTVYAIDVKGTGASRLSYAKLYELVKGLDNIWIDFDDTLSTAYVTLDGHKYSVYRDELSKDMKKIYTYMTEEERADREALADMLPYEGMDAKYINDTRLGKPDAEWGGNYYDESTKSTRREKVYTWLNNNQDRQAEATVRESYGGTWRITEVTIYGAAYRPGDTGVYKPTATSVPKPRETSNSVTKDDEYDVYDYSNPDDFYYDHPDDFFDYEDAEDYYYEHAD